MRTTDSNNTAVSSTYLRVPAFHGCRHGPVHHMHTHVLLLLAVDVLVLRNKMSCCRSFFLARTNHGVSTNTYIQAQYRYIFSTTIVRTVVKCGTAVTAVCPMIRCCSLWYIRVSAWIIWIIYDMFILRSIYLCLHSHNLQRVNREKKTEKQIIIIYVYIYIVLWCPHWMPQDAILLFPAIFFYNIRQISKVFMPGSYTSAVTLTDWTVHTINKLCKLRDTSGSFVLPDMFHLWLTRVFRNFRSTS